MAARTLTGLSRRKQREPRRLFWAFLAAPGILWLTLLFIVPFYAVLAIGMGRLNQLFGTPIAVWNPFEWSSSNVINVSRDLVGSTAFAGPIVVRTVVYVAIAALLCLLSGSVTRRNVRARPRPRSRPASIRAGSIRSSPANSTRIRYGM